MGDEGNQSANFGNNELRKFMYQLQYKTLGGKVERQ